MMFPSQLMASVAAVIATADAAPLKVFVLAGQSNMEGQAEVSHLYPNGTEMNGTLTYQLHDPRTAAEFAPTWDNATRNWTVRSDVWVWFNEKGKTDDGTWGDLSVGYGCLGSRDHIGPEFGFGYAMGDALKEQVLIIKAAWGGKTLGGDFRPPTSAKKSGAVGHYYQQMIQDVRDVLAPGNMSKLFPGYSAETGYQIVGFGWDQGWNDGCSESLVAEYEANLVNLIADLRTEWKAPTMAVSIPVSGFGGWTQKNTRRLGIIQAQFNAANATRHPELGGHVIAEETRGFWRDPAFCPSKQAYHWGHNAESYWLIGQAMGAGMLKMMAPSSGDRGHSTGLLAVPATATATAIATATAATATATAGHYGDPSKGPCLAGEENVNVQGVPGDWCSPACVGTPCPAAPSGSATPMCALAIGGTSPNHCALICTVSDDDAWRRLPVGSGGCPAGMDCHPAAGRGVCTWPVPPPPPPALPYSHCSQSTSDCPMCLNGYAFCGPACTVPGNDPVGKDCPLPSRLLNTTLPPYCMFANNGSPKNDVCGLLCTVTSTVAKGCKVWSDGKACNNDGCPTGAVCYPTNLTTVPDACAKGTHSGNAGDCGTCLFTKP